jgi:RNA polymerase sporulation-specific sigma factor
MGRLSGSQKQENDKLVEYVKRVKRDNDEEAFKQIVRALHSFLIHLSNRKFYRIPGNNSDDVYQEGLLALSTKAIPDYKEEKGAFLSFAKLCIRRHIITVLKSANNNKNRTLNGSVSLDATACDDQDEGPVTVSGFISNGEEDIVEVLSRMETHKNLKSLLTKKLTKLEMEVLECYLQNMSYVDIVNHMNRKRRGRNRVDTKVCDNALCRLKKKSFELLQEMGIDDLS